MGEGINNYILKIAMYHFFSISVNLSKTFLCVWLAYMGLSINGKNTGQLLTRLWWPRLLHCRPKEKTFGQWVDEWVSQCQLHAVRQSPWLLRRQMISVLQTIPDWNFTFLARQWFLHMFNPPDIWSIRIKTLTFNKDQWCQGLQTWKSLSSMDSLPVLFRERWIVFSNYSTVKMPMSHSWAAR